MKFKREDIILVLVVIETLVLIGLIVYSVIPAKINADTNANVLVDARTIPSFDSSEVNTICPKICTEKGYDGWYEGRDYSGEKATICDCYRLIQSVPQDKLN